MTRAPALIQACIGGPPFTMKERKQMKQFNKMIIVSACAAFLFACGGNSKNHDSDDSDVTDAGIISSDAGTDASVQTVDASQPTDDASIPPVSLDNYGPTDIVLSYRKGGGYYRGAAIPSIYTEHGYAWFVVTGDCRYRAFSAFANDGNGFHYLADVVQGQLSKDECETLIAKAFIRTQYLNESCTEVSVEGPTEATVHFITLGEYTLACYHSCCDESDPDQHPMECGIQTQTKSTLARFLDDGEPIDGKLRGYLTLAPENAMVSSGAPLQFSETLPEGMEALLQTQEQTPNGPSPSFFKSAIFPDEYQDAVKSLRQKVLNGTMNCSSQGGIPVIDSSGTKYLIYARQVTDIEDAETGIISFPNACL